MELSDQRIDDDYIHLDRIQIPTENGVGVGGRRHTLTPTHTLTQLTSSYVPSSIPFLTNKFNICINNNNNNNNRNPSASGLVGSAMSLSSSSSTVNMRINNSIE
ncbi:unnamed protein product [Rotaria magnacalcarata]|uniref:Uncharacterized protein n=1 Tax=Rotaria magnacalcarata TaxID=392030 RepID=A0A816PMH1_9BILA|nr:unnamed protein product [Rotaria magnacalcarata]CAF2050303.1 unnamed protein product [Rotaria magnacalcarata]